MRKIYFNEFGKGRFVSTLESQLNSSPDLYIAFYFVEFDFKKPRELRLKRICRELVPEVNGLTKK